MINSLHKGKIKWNKGAGVVMAIAVVALVMIFGTIAVTMSLNAVSMAKENLYADQAYLNARSALDMMVDELITAHSKEYPDNDADKAKRLDVIIESAIMESEKNGAESGIIEITDMSYSGISGDISGAVEYKLDEEKSESGEETEDAQYTKVYDVTIAFTATVNGHTRTASASLWWGYNPDNSPFDIFERDAKVEWDVSKTGSYNKDFHIVKISGDYEIGDLYYNVSSTARYTVFDCYGVTLKLENDILLDGKVIFTGSLTTVDVRGKHNVFAYFDMSNVMFYSTVDLEEDEELPPPHMVELRGGARNPQWHIEQISDVNVTPVQLSYTERPPIISIDNKSIYIWEVYTRGK